MLFVGAYDVRKGHMLVSEPYCSCFHWHVNSRFRTVMQTGVTHLAMVGEFCTPASVMIILLAGQTLTQMHNGCSRR